MMLVTTFCYISIVSQTIFYEATVFNRLDGKFERKARLKSTLIAAGPPALACFLCAICTTIPLFDSSVESFRLILKIAYTTMAVGFAHVFLFLPVALSVATPEAVSYATLRLRRRFTKQTPQPPSPEVHFDGGVNILQEPEPIELANNQVHFAARSPAQRHDSISSRVSLRFHHKNACLRAVLHSLPSPIESVTSEEEKAHATEDLQPSSDPAQYDSLKNLSISAQQSEDRAEHEYTLGTQGSLPDRPEATTSTH
ncbi:hypothetical protein RvY_14701-3 [Ramazzottius varieornatus]|nr:hypothetical protein RvY_14701-3 [Ramazzottius varieornatus]